MPRPLRSQTAQMRDYTTDSYRIEPHLFVPHPHLSDQINHNICQSEIEGGLFLQHLPPGAVLEVETQNRHYLLENQGEGKALIAGHPEFCPRPVLVDVHGSTWGGSMLKMGFVGRGMRLEFRHPAHGIIHTSLIQEIREIDAAARSRTTRSWQAATAGRAALRAA